MKVAIIGSRNLKITNIKEYLPPETTEIISGGARGVDSCAREYALKNGIKLTEYLPDYDLYDGKTAPLMRNLEIVRNSDLVIAFWDGKSRGTAHTIKKCVEFDTPVKIYNV